MRSLASLLLLPAFAMAAPGQKGKIEGSVLGPDGKPVSGATVDCIKGVGGGDNTSACGAFTTAADGAFALAAPAGVVTVWARAPGLAEGRSALVVSGGGVAKTQVQLQPASSVVGVAKTEDGKPVPNANVRCGALDDLGPVQQLQAGKDGSFTCKDVGSGPVEVLAWTEKERGAGMAMVEPGSKTELPMALSDREGAGARTQVSGISGLNLAALPPAQDGAPGVVRGRVVDAASKKPLASVGVRVKPGRWAVTGPDGRFSAIAGPGPTVIDLATAPKRGGAFVATVPADGEVDVGEVRAATGDAAQDLYGLGAEATADGVVLRPKLDGPAFLAGARGGDKLVMVAGRDVAKMQLGDVLVALAKGKKIAMTIERDGKKQELRIARK